MSAGGVGRPSLLVLRALGLGDLLTAVPALRAIRRAFPDHYRVLATTAPLEPLALHASVADHVVAAQPFGPVTGAPSPLDVAVNLHGKGPQSHLVLDALEPRHLIGFASAGFTGPEWVPGEHEVHRWCRLLSESGVPADPGDLDIPPPPLDRHLAGATAEAGGHGGGGACRPTIIHPGAASGARRWPPERWASVARAEQEAGRDVVVTGGEEERELAQRVAGEAGLPPSAVLAGTLGILDLASLVAHAGRLVCGDTGVAHLATALRTPSVVLFGPVPPSEWGPPPDRRWHVALWAGRRGDPHARHPDPGLLEIEVADVVAALAVLPTANEAMALPQT